MIMHADFRHFGTLGILIEKEVSRRSCGRSATYNRNLRHKGLLM
jgi:hypothetical protein